MSKLSTYRRNELPKSVFGLPERRAYPMPDRSHAANAKARASQQYKRGKLSKEQLQAIFGKADRVLGKR